MASIEELDGERWPDPSSGETDLIRRCLALRRKDLGQFTVEDHRVLIGQQIAVAILLPRVIKILTRSPLVAGDYYPGDLLAAVLRLPAEVWTPQLRERLATAIAPLGESVPERLRPAVRSFLAS